LKFQVGKKLNFQNETIKSYSAKILRPSKSIRKLDNFSKNPEGLDKKSDKNQGEKCQEFFSRFFRLAGLRGKNLQDATSIKEVVATREDDVWGKLWSKLKGPSLQT